MEIIIKEVTNSLQNDEWILWKRIKMVNLLKFIPYNIIFNIILTLLCVLGILMFFFMVPFLLVGIILSNSSIIMRYRNLKEKLEISYKELKNYPSYLVLTTKRFICKDFYLINNAELSEYPSGAIEVVNNILYLNMNYIEKILVDRPYQVINFIIRGDNGEILSDIYFQYYDIELLKLMEIFIDSLNFEKKKENKEYIVLKREN